MCLLHIGTASQLRSSNETSALLLPLRSWMRSGGSPSERRGFGWGFTGRMIMLFWKVDSELVDAGGLWLRALDIRWLLLLGSTWVDWNFGGQR